MKQKNTPFTLLCQINNGCMGCCGHDFISKEKICNAIRINTIEFNSLNLKTEQELIAFRERANSMNLRNGVCRNLIEKESQIFCPLHPNKNKGKDLRLGHCDIFHLCETAKKFESWSYEQQEQFLEFIRSKNLDNIAYSIKMDDNSLLKEFTAAKMKPSPNWSEH